MSIIKPVMATVGVTSFGIAIVSLNDSAISYICLAIAAISVFVLNFLKEKEKENRVHDSEKNLTDICSEIKELKMISEKNLSSITPVLQSIINSNQKAVESFSSKTDENFSQLINAVKSESEKHIKITTQTLQENQIMRKESESIKYELNFLNEKFNEKILPNMNKIIEENTKLKSVVIEGHSSVLSSFKNEFIPEISRSMSEIDLNINNSLKNIANVTGDIIERIENNHGDLEELLDENIYEELENVKDINRYLLEVTVKNLGLNQDIVDRGKEIQQILSDTKQEIADSKIPERERALKLQDKIIEDIKREG